MTKNINRTEEYFLKQQNRCLLLLSAYTNKKDAEDLHQLRVSIKKIKAIFLMVDKLQANFGFDKNYAPYKAIFKHLAPIRDEMLQNKKLKNQPLNKQQKNKHLRLIAGLNKKLKLAAPGYLNTINKALPSIIHSLGKIRQKDIYPYCKKLLHHVKSNWNGIKTDNGLHQYRKQLKQFLYCSGLLTSKERGRLLSSKKRKRMDKLQDEIGQWHDNILLLAKIEKGHLKVSRPFLLLLQNKTKVLHKNVTRSGNKL